MPNFVNLMAPAGVGGTFFVWSIYYLSSANLKYDCLLQRDKTETFDPIIDISVTDNPLNSKNSHAFRKTHPCTATQFNHVWDKFVHTGWSNDVFVAYTVNDMVNDSFYDDIIANYPDIYKHVLFLYDLQRDTDFVFDGIYTRTPTDLFGKKSFLQFPDKESNELTGYDLKEKFSLYYPNMVNTQLDASNSVTNKQHTNVISVDYYKFINEFDKLIPDLFDDLNIAFHESRFEQWKSVYKKWQTITDLNFFNDLDQIVLDIVNNNSRDLQAYNINDSKEIILMSKLLFNHNLTLKISEIGNVIANTTDWYPLLEENIFHNLNESLA